MWGMPLEQVFSIELADGTGRKVLTGTEFLEMLIGFFTMCERPNGIIFTSLGCANSTLAAVK